MRYKNKSCLVYDFGLFVELAATLARDFGKVFYFSSWANGYPRSNPLLIGKGIPGVERVNAIWPLIDEVDVWVFPDVYEGPLQEHLVNMGKRVWGARLGEELELDRVASKKHCAKLGIDIGPYKVIKGLSALRDHLRENKDQYVKISSTRGDMETFKSKNYRLIEPRLDELEHNLGAKKYIMEFIVEEMISPAVEVGYDGYTIDGKFAKGSFFGVEVKDKSYVGKSTRYDKLPEEIRGVNDKLSGTFADYGYRGFFSSEIRITPDHKAYLIDPCCRCGSPPNELYQIMVANLADIIWEGAGGVVVEPEFNAKFGAMLLLNSEWAIKHWQAVEFPRQYRENVKIRNLAVIEKRLYHVPQVSECSQIGAVVAIGDSMQSAIDECKAIAGKVEGHYIDCAADSLDDAESEFAKLREFGITV
jgi:hypothetical protein